MGFKRPLVRLQSLGPKDPSCMSKADFLHFEVTGRTSGLFCHPRAVPPPCGGSEWGHHAADNALGIVAGSTPVTRTKNSVLHEQGGFFAFSGRRKTRRPLFLYIKYRILEKPCILCRTMLTFSADTFFFDNIRLLPPMEAGCLL